MQVTITVVYKSFCTNKIHFDFEVKEITCFSVSQIPLHIFSRHFFLIIIIYLAETEHIVAFMQ